MRILNLSGGATKISGLYGVAEAIMYDHLWKPDVITGISSGSILAVPLALGLFDETRERVLSFNLDNIFDKKPVNDKGKLTVSALTRILSGKLSMGTQNNLVNTVSELITNERFKEYVEGEYPIVWIMAVDFKTGNKCVYNVKELSYEDYLNVVKASCSIPGYVEPVKFDGKILFDGGVRDHILSKWSLDYYKENVKEIVSIYSRPNPSTPITHLKLRNIVDVIKRTLQIMTLEISESDEELEELMAKHLGIKRRAYFLPRLMASEYDVDKNKIKELYLIGKGLLNGENYA